jgi:NAD(P)-dependent dehydrogenase (short-subunit alcohol dehydrogenase family)
LSQARLPVRYHFFKILFHRLETANISQGIGRQVAISFAAEGCPKIAICDQNETGLTETRSLIHSNYPNVQVEIFVLDVSDEQSVVAMTASIVDKLGRIDYAVNSAGVGGHNSISTSTPTSTYDHITSINARGLWLCSRSQLSQMLTQEPLPTHDGRPGNRGSIVNIGSQLGVVGRPGAVAYSAAKAAVISMTRSDGIDVSCIR